jgi:cytochrome oxidase Cu insertion factor (SCO1/SenC/PrrC family)
VAALALVLWIVAGLFWWAFAFMPLPLAPPPWLGAARAACFGTTASGLPDAAGWLLLAVAPVTLLAGILAVWGREVRALLRSAPRTPVGRAAIVLLAVAVAVEGTWVGAKIRTAWRITDVEAAVAGVAAELPRDYPRGTAAAADFTLVDHHGARVTLSAFRGRPVVLTFVFAHCATLCPALVETAKRAVDGDGRAVLLLVTLDPWRDTPSALPAIARQWRLPASAHLLSARNAGTVTDVARAYVVPFNRDEATGDIAHPAVVFVVDADGRLAYAFNNPPAAWLRQALARLG